MQYKLPERFTKAISAVLKLEQPDFDEFLSCLSSLRPAASPQILEEEFRQEFSKPLIDSRDLFEVVMSLYLLRDSHPEEKDIAGDIIKSLELDGDQPLLTRKLEQVLSFESSLGVTAHALGLSNDNEKALVSCRILTDVRGIFLDDGTAPSGALVAHTLKLTFLQDGEQRNLYFSMDSTDLDEMERAITRARKKQDGLKEMVRKAGITTLRGE